MIIIYIHLSPGLLDDSLDVVGMWCPYGTKCSPINLKKLQGVNKKKMKKEVVSCVRRQVLTKDIILSNVLHFVVIFT